MAGYHDEHENEYDLRHPKVDAAPAKLSWRDQLIAELDAALGGHPDVNDSWWRDCGTIRAKLASIPGVAIDFAPIVADLVRECERAIKQREETLADPTKRGVDGRTHDTLFEHVLRLHLDTTYAFFKGKDAPEPAASTTQPPRIRDNGEQNPTITFDPDLVHKLLRRAVDEETVYADRGMVAVQFAWTEKGERRVWLDIPELTVMVSNVPSSRS